MVLLHATLHIQMIGFQSAIDRSLKLINKCCRVVNSTYRPLSEICRMAALGYRLNRSIADCRHK